jgi:hypothetical protein
MWHYPSGTSKLLMNPSIIQTPKILLSSGIQSDHAGSIICGTLTGSFTSDSVIDPKISEL